MSPAYLPTSAVQSHVDYAQLPGSDGGGIAGQGTSGGNPRRGQAAITRYGCGSCHTIPGVRGARSLVGPSLEHMAQRIYIAGVLPNTRGNMLKWIQNPPGVDEKTAMPNLGITPHDSKDIASYLYTLHY